MNRFALGALSLLVSCTWVSDEDVDARLSQMDNDGDGFTQDGGGVEAEIDCDDDNANIFPGADDPWYDGIDSDCDGANDWDKDGDGFSKEGCEEFGCEGEPGDCNDENPAVNPAATEIWYDNIDGDCNDDDDFDADFDGYRILTASGGDDCDDSDPTINVAATEVWYDGVDQNCDGENDYDQDGDLYVVAGCEDTSDCRGARGGDDCDDAVADVNPGVAERWYDGVDGNCDGLNDFDQDLDGYVQDGCESEHPDCASGALPGDCDDQARLIYPGGVEDVSDLSYDGDCDGEPDSVAMVTLDVTLDAGQSLRAAEYSSNVYLIPAADAFSYTTGEQLFDTAVAHPVGFVPPVVSEVDYSALHPWPVTNLSDPAATIATGQQVQTVLMDSRSWFCGAYGETSANGRTLALVCYQLSTQGGGGVGSRRFLPSNSALTEPFSDIGFGVDSDGTFHAFGCSDVGGGTLQYLVATDNDLASSIPSSTGNFSGVRASSCSVYIPDDGSGLGLLSYIEDGGDHVVVSWDAESASSTPFSGAFADYFTELYRGAPTGALDVELSQPSDGPLLELLITSDGDISVYDGGVDGGVAYPVGNIVGATQANLVWNDNRDSVYVTWVDDAGVAWLAWSDLDGSADFTVAALGTDFAVNEVVPFYSSTQYLYIGAMGDAELAVVGIEAP